ncbi:Hypothetical protein NGAL_HAMBI490_55340 [Neorhizobium galegae bv. officinalis]|nr:Hypothetical protein NGAL_HAMBI490_55340 [Neorhizobium galegae bv. officinalis]
MDFALFTDPTVWQKFFYFVGSLAALRILFVAGRFRTFMDDMDYRDKYRFGNERDKRTGG